MSFTANVKQTGKIFEATGELDKNGIRAFDAQTLEDCNDGNAQPHANQSGSTGCRSSRSTCSTLKGFPSTGRCCKACGSFSRTSVGSAVMIAI
jgi:hypothetical protein